MTLLRAGQCVLSAEQVMPSKAHPFKMSTSDLVRSIVNGYLADDALIAGQLDDNYRAFSSADNNQDIRPYGLVVCSIWEYDHSFLSTKMFRWALKSLAEQSRYSGIDLDFVIVLNNGGSIDATVRAELAFRMPKMIEEALPDHVLETVVTTPPDCPLERTAPWNINADLPSRYDRLAGHPGRALLVVQPFNPLNRGKISALRDVVHFLKSQIASNSYFADFLFQMDAETILRFRRPSYSGTTSPFGDLFRFFSERNYTAVGTRDRFSVFDSDTGRPLAKPVATLQIGWEIRNSEGPIVTLPGGALMAKVSSYIAAMTQLTHHFPGLVAEDYAYTKLLRYSFAYASKRFEDYVELHPAIEHLNRTPRETKSAFHQLETWRHQTNAVDSVFPGDNFVPMDFMRASLLLVARRIRDIRYYGPSSIAMLVKDAIGLPAACRIAYSSICSDIGASRVA